jgi:ribosome-associated protein
MAAKNKDEPRVVSVRAVPIELSQLLKFSGLTGTGGEAKRMIMEGQVFLNGRVETQKGKKIHAGDRVRFGAETIVVQVE